MTVKKEYNVVKEKVVLGFILFISIVLILTTEIVLVNTVYRYNKENADALAQKEIIITANEANKAIEEAINLCDSFSISVEYCFERGDSNDYILEYLIDQTDLYQGINPNYRGFYGYIRGEFLDGNEWDYKSLPEPYVPTERPWYIDAVAANGSSTICEPYIDAETNTLVLSCSKLLSDGESVFCVDLKLTNFKNLIDNIKIGSRSVSYILDDNGLIVSAADPELFGKSYLSEENLSISPFAEDISKIVETRESYETNIDGKYYNVYCEDLKDFWQIVVFVSKADVYQIPTVILLLGIGLCLCLAGLFIFYGIRTFRNANLIKAASNDKVEMLEMHEIALKNDYSIISSFAGQFSYVCLVNTVSNTIVNYLVDGIFLKYIGNKKTIEPYDFDFLIKTLSKNHNVDEFRRLSNRDMIMSYLGNHTEYSFLYDFEDDGKIYNYRVTFSMQHNNRTSVVIGFKDISDELREQREKADAIYRASIDGLTGLLNKVSFNDKILEDLKEHGSKRTALIMLDLDFFKNVNDTFGHLKGDLVLQEVASILNANLTRGQYISRLGGDEYGVFFPNISRELLETKLKELASKLVITVNEGENSLSVSASLGCVFCKGFNVTLDEMLQKVDETLYEVKNSGRNGYKIIEL